MTENDIVLISIALNADNWDECCGLEEKTDTEFARQKIHNRKMDLYRRELASAGM